MANISVEAFGSCSELRDVDEEEVDDDEYISLQYIADSDFEDDWAADVLKHCGRKRVRNKTHYAETEVLEVAYAWIQQS